MPHFDIIKKADPGESFRVKSVMGSYDMTAAHTEEHFSGDIDLPEEWNIGLIVGRSGTGKTTIARELFGDCIINGYEYTHESILDDMPKGASVQEICQALTSVGFASPPSWLKPYAVLSNGEKMRCDLARAILEKRDLFVFDEFTSVVDRNVAKVGSLAMQKAIRRGGQKFIAVTCHADVEPWLMPDWVFNTDTMTFSTKDLEEQKKNRPGIVLDIYEIKDNKADYWRVFRKYHYLTGQFQKGARVWLCYANGQLAGFTSFLHYPTPHYDNLKKAHRVVVLPDYQGIGIAKTMLKVAASQMKHEGFKVTLCSSNVAMIMSMKRNPDWSCIRLGRQCAWNKWTMPSLRASNSQNRITGNFEYVGQ